MKLLKRKNFQALIYAIFISLPMLSILPSTIYFAFNEHAQNYTHEEVIETYEYETNEVNSVDDLLVGNIYSVNLENYVVPSNLSMTLDFTNIYHFNFESTNNLVQTSTGGYVIFISNSRLGVCYTRYETGNGYMYPAVRTDTFNDTINLSCEIVYSAQVNISAIIQYISASNYLGEKNVEVIESEMNPLTAFDNAINKFVSDNDFGNLDFFTFFSSLFLTSTSMNNLYIHFINWYMNYALYVSLAYLLFGVLLYFVNFFRKLVENSEDTHIGGF